MTQTTEVAVPEVDVSDDLDPTTWYRAEGEDVPSIDGEAISAQMVARILSATSLEEIMRPVTTTDAESILNETLVLRGYSKMPSTKKDSRLRFYLLLDCVNMDGEPVTVSCGSANVMARTIALSRNGHLPAYVAIVQSPRPTASGYYPLDLEPRTKPGADVPSSSTSGDF